MLNALQETIRNLKAIDGVSTQETPPLKYAPLPGVRSSTAKLSAPVPPAPDWHSVCQRAAAGIYELSDTDLAAVRDLQKRCAKIRDDIQNKFTRDAAAKDFANNQRAEWDKFYAQSNPDLSAMKLPTLQALEEDYVNRAKIAQRIFDQLCADAVTLCAPIRRNFISAATDELQRLEQAEYTEAQAYGYPYNPGPRVLALRMLLGNLRTREKDNAAGTPAQLLPWLKL